MTGVFLGAGRDVKSGGLEHEGVAFTEANEESES